MEEQHDFIALFSTLRKPQKKDDWEIIFFLITLFKPKFHWKSIRLKSSWV
jgi:hypothetical protein